MNFVGNLINKTGNRIPEPRSDGIRMYKAINAVINASPSEFTQNLESFRRYIHQWAYSLQGHKSLTDGCQLRLKASFVEYVTYGMHNQHIVDVKDIGERSFSLLSNERKPFFYITNIKTNIVHLILTIEGCGPVVGPHHSNAIAPTIVENDVIFLLDHGWTELI